jgi:hypothetical protein
VMTNMTERPSALPAICAPVSGARSRSASFVAHESVGHQAVWARPEADTSQFSQVRSVQAGPNPVQADTVRTAESNQTTGTNGSRGKGIPMSKKLVMDARGVPPRGRPV